MPPEVLALGAAGLAVVSVLLIVAALSGGSSVSDRLRRYAAAADGDAQPRERERVGLGDKIASSAALANLNRTLEGQDWGAKTARELARADLSLKPSEFLVIRLAVLVGVPTGMIALSPFVPVLSGPLPWFGGLLVGLFGPRLWLGRRKARRLKKFNASLADTITLLANALRAGSSFLQSIELVVRETEPPISTEFGRVIREVNLGLPLEQALSNMNRRVRSDDLDLMTTAISIHHQVGGNLAEILDSIAFTIRERVRIKGEIRTLTAQQRMSGYVVGFLPIALVGIISLISPKFMEPMFLQPPSMFGLPLGMVVLSGGAFMMLLGFMLIRRIVDIKV